MTLRRIFLKHTKVLLYYYGYYESDVLCASIKLTDSKKNLENKTKVTQGMPAEGEETSIIMALVVFIWDSLSPEIDRRLVEN